jgi:L-amino acid N-acyltransferase YncA
VSDGVELRHVEDGTILACRDGATLGTVTYGPFRDDERLGEVVRVEVVDGERRRGVGTSLLVAAEDALQAAGFEEAVAWIDQADEGAQRFFAWHTWSTDGEIREVGDVTLARYRRLLGF